MGLETGRVPGSSRAFGTAACWVGLCHWASPLTVSVWVGVLCPSSQRAGIDGTERRGKADGLISLETFSPAPRSPPFIQLLRHQLRVSIAPHPPPPPSPPRPPTKSLTSRVCIRSTFPPSLCKAPPPTPRPAWCSPLVCSQEARPNRPLSGSAGPVLVTRPRAPGPLLRA